MSAKILEQVRITAAAPPELAVVVGWQPGVGIEVELEGGAVSLARTILSVSAEQLNTAVALRSEVLVTFVGNDRKRPMVLGFIAEIPSAPAQPDDGTAQAEGTPDVIRVRAHEEIQFRCGKASLTLRRDGAVVIRGDKIVSRAVKNNRITGGSVQIN